MRRVVKCYGCGRCDHFITLCNFMQAHEETAPSFECVNTVRGSNSGFGVQRLAGKTLHVTTAKPVVNKRIQYIFFLSATPIVSTLSISEFSDAIAWRLHPLRESSGQIQKRLKVPLAYY